MRVFRKLSMGKRVLAIVLCALMVATIIPIGTLISVNAASGDPANVTLDGFPTYMDGLTVQLTEVPGSDIENGIIASGSVSFTLKEDSEYAVAILKNGTVVAQYGSKVEATSAATAGFTAPIDVSGWAPTVEAPAFSTLPNTVAVDFGDDVTFTATASPNNIGDVEFLWEVDDGQGGGWSAESTSNTLALGNATMTMNSWQVRCTLSYTVASGITASSNTVPTTLAVTRKAVTVSVAASPVSGTATWGDNVTLTATIAGIANSTNATGTITFKEDGTAISGASNLPIIANVTTHGYVMDAVHGTITAEYTGDTNYLPQTGTLGAYSVNKRDQAPLTPPTLVTAQYPNTIDVSILGGGSTGETVTYEIINQGSGAATLSGTTLSATLVGTFRIKATMPASLPANQNYNPKTVEYDITIEPKPITIINTAVSNKTYDNSTSASFSGTPAFAVGAIESADTSKVSLVNGIPTFDSKNVATGITISFTNFTMSGDNRQNYTITQPTPGTANITKRTLNVAPDANQGKLYNSTPEPTLTYTWSNVAPGETITASNISGALTRATGEGTPAGGETYKILAGTLALVDNGGVLANTNYNLVVDETVDFTIRAFTTADEAASNQVNTGNTTNTTGGSKGWASANPITLNAPTGYTISLTNNGSDWAANVMAPTQTNNETAVTIEYFLKRDNDQAVTQKSYVYSYDDVKPQNLGVSYSVSLTEKIKQLVTFGYYNPSVTVTISAYDDTAGINHFNWTYTQRTGSSSTNLPTESGQIDSGAISYTNGGKTATAIFTLTGEAAKQYDGSILFTATDNAANTSSSLDDSTNNVVIVDTIKPQVEISYTGNLTDKVLPDPASGKPSRATVSTVDDDTRLIYKGDITVTVEVTDANFYPNGNQDADYDADDILITATRNGVKYPLAFTASSWVKSGDKYTLDFTLSGDGDYVVNAVYKDRSMNNMEWKSGEYSTKAGETTYKSNVLTIDNIAPVIAITYNPATSTPNADTYKTSRAATIRVTDKNFRPSEIAPAFTAKDVSNTTVNSALTDINTKGNALKNWAAWEYQGSDVWEATLTFSEDAKYEFSLNYTDLSTNPAATYTATPFIIDANNTPPTNLTISYSTSLLDKVANLVTFGYYNPSVTVTIKADDATSGVDYFNWTYTREPGVSSVKNIATETNQINSGDIVYSNNGKTATATFTLTGDAAKQYRGSIKFIATDKAGNASGTLDDTANEVVVVDTINPVAKISYAGTLTDKVKTDTTKDTVNPANASTRFVYSGDITATVEIEDANFYPNDNPKGAGYDSDDVRITVSKLLDGATTDYPLSYTKSSWTQTGDKWTLTFTLSGDGDYTVSVVQKDRSQNGMDWESAEYSGKTGNTTYTSNTLTIDTTAPTISVTYNPAASTPNAETYKTDRTATIQITDRNFRPYELTPSFTAKDIQGSNVAAFDIVALTTELQSWAKWSEVSRNVWETTVTFSVDAHYTFGLSYKDLGNNQLSPYAATPFSIDHNAPTNLTISYSTSLLDKVISAVTFGYYNPSVTVTIKADDITSGVDYFNWKYTQEPGTSTEKNVAEESAQINTGDITYSGSGKTATATFTLTGDAAKQYRGSIEFTATDKAGNTSGTLDDKSNEIVVVDTISPTRTVTYPAPKQIVNKNDLTTSSVDVNTESTSSIFYYDGNVTATIKVTEANFYAEDVVVKVNGVAQATAWSKNADEFTGTVTLSGDGDYIITVNYTDRSTNKMVDYQSEQITIDTINPTVAVSYAPAKVIRTLDGRTYYDAVQTATVTITEHNFRADDVAASITAKDVTGADVSGTLVSSLKAHLSNRSSWTKNGDVYTATITYADDANYTFDIDYKDLALRQIADYMPDLFTVDTTAPTNYKVSFSQNVFETAIDAISFGYYQGKVTVTVSADDATSGVYRFVYDYKNSESVSAVNAELLKQAIEYASITYTNSGKTATATFEIPRDVLTNNNQFNGTVAFTSYDRSDNSTDEIDNRRLVVDNIAPTATITYNQPVKNANGISYYAGDVNATINITEANFFSQDVKVSATKGGAPVAVNVSWKDNSVDSHTGTFTLTGDGDYIVSMTYTDRSGNQMTDYKSNQLTIDTQKPTIRVDGIKSESANNEKGNIGFTITANDTNFDTSKFNPVLTAVVKDGSGFKTVTIANPTLKTITAGKEYAYTFENLDADGIYSLKCTVTDMSDNTFSDIVVTDSSNASMQTVVFSVNRDGSTFMLDDNTTKLVNTFYVQKAYNDVVVIETNADPLRSYKVTINGTEKKEGTDYTVAQTGGDGNWNKYTYTIKKELFENEGEYKVVVSSKDKAENDAYSDIKSAEVNFVVDRTAPVLTISGLQDGGRYQVEKQTVTVMPKDDGGKLKSIKVIVTDGSNNSTVLDLSGEDLLSALESGSGKLTFEIPSGYNQSVQILCNDMAQDDKGDTNLYDNTFKNVTVSTNIFVIYFANKPLFFGTIGGAVVIAGLLWFFLIFKRRKKDEDDKASAKAK